MIDVEGSKGLILIHLYKRLGINNKIYYNSILYMRDRFLIHLGKEKLNRGKVYRAWTSRNFTTNVTKQTIVNRSNLIYEA